MFCLQVLWFDLFVSQYTELMTHSFLFHELWQRFSSLLHDIEQFQFFDPGSRIFDFFLFHLNLWNKVSSLWFFFKYLFKLSLFRTPRQWKFLILDFLKIELIEYHLEAERKSSTIWWIERNERVICLAFHNIGKN